MRRVIGFLLASSISTASLAGAGDALVMPFECGLEAGHVKVSPAAQRRYPIVGERERQSITTCRGPAECRTATVYRFVISCGGAGIAWMRVAAAIQSSFDAPVWIERGRLNLVLPANGASRSPRSCGGRPAFALGDGGVQRVAYTGGCAGVPQRTDFERVVLPAGFAPVDELGAKLIPAVDEQRPGSRKAGPQMVAARRSSATVGETLVAKADTDSLVAPIPGLEPYEPALEPSLAADDWVTIVRAEPPLAIAPQAAAGPGPIPWTALLLALALATSAGLAAMQFGRSYRVSASAPARRRNALLSIATWSLQRSVPIRKFTNAGAAVSSLLDQTGVIIAELKGAGPLREVLQSELALVRQRLSVIEAAAAKDGDGSAKNAPQFRALIRELERIRRIASSAAASLSRGSRGSTLPGTVSEAYDVLGINPDVGEDVMKKIVDALRMSWHPDHARNDVDRAERERRIRQINVAWELITAKRAAA